ncbi:MAG: FixH family protein [Gemmatimonadaceae bacterium]|nr:FixH family protein [Gemmatimonadaceae bacterium]
MKPGMGWPIGIVAILSITVIANLVVMRVANNDPSFAIEPDYYKKAVAFDSTIAEERRSATLGWTATSTIVAGDSAGRPMLTVTLLDAQQRPVQGATVSVVALANIRSNDLVSATLTEVAPGRYQSLLAAHVAGQWEVRVDAVRGTDHFVASTRTDVAAAGTPTTTDTIHQGGSER